MRPSLWCLSALLALTKADYGVISNYSAYQPDNQFGDAPGQKYLSNPRLFSPIFNAPTWNDSLIEKGRPHLFFALELLGSLGPYIFSSDDLSLVYEDRSFAFVNNVRVQDYKGEKYLTYWAGNIGKGYASGKCHMLNKHYETVFEVTSGKGLKNGADLHECEITHDNTVLITIYEPLFDFDLTAVGGNSSDILLDSVFQEVDPETGNILFHWRGSDHLPITAGYKEYDPNTPDGWDAWHINSMQKTKDGNFVVDFRRSHAVLLINGTDGSPIWHVGGKTNDFRDLDGGDAIDFAWQHHAKFLDDDLTQLTFFDNHIYRDVVDCQGQKCSRATWLELTHEPERTVRKKAEFFAPHGLGSYAMGSMEIMDNGNVLVGWGSQAGFTEYLPTGEPVMDVQYGRYGTWVRTYRVYKDKWVGYPKWNPRLAVDHPKNQILASWNGATEIKSWVVMTAQKQATLTNFDAMNWADETQVMHTYRSGFETAIPIELGKAKFVRAAALDVEGKVLGATDIVEVVSGESQAVDKPLKDAIYSNKINAIISAKAFNSDTFEPPLT